MDATLTRVVLVPHTHWDREWYRTHEQFRYQLVRLVDGLLDLLDGDPGFRHFLLDGQTIAVDDYLEVRPGARERIEKRVREGRLAIGPWTVLPDEWLVSGEALIRNLRAGIARAEALGGAMRVGYVPDQFGHVGQLPQIFAGFGLDGAVLWRGVGADVGESLFRWEAPDGSRVLVAYLPRGYGHGAGLPLEPAALAARLREEIEGLRPFTRSPLVLVMNGGDHLSPQAGLPEALAAAAPGLPEAVCEIGGLESFLARARERAPSELPVHRGELRSGLRAPLLPGCASAHAPLKRADFHCDRLLTRYLEPLAAWLSALGGFADVEYLKRIWRLLLENHPHDSICGCSVDRVHEEMATRYRRIEEMASEHWERVTSELAAHVAGPDGSAGERLIVWNPHVAGRAEVDASFELARPGRARRVVTAEGTRLAAQAETLVPERVQLQLRLPKAVLSALLSGLGQVLFGRPIGAVSLRRRGDELRLEVRLASRYARGLDLDAARRRIAAALADERIAWVAVQVREPGRVRLRFVDDLPGHGLRVYRLEPETAAERRAPTALRAEDTREGGVRLENEFWRVEVDALGAVVLHHRPSGTTIPDALRLVSEGDRGDAYNFDPVPGEERVERPARVRVAWEHAVGAAVAARIDGVYAVPRGLAGDRRSRTARRVRLPVRTRLRLAAGLDRVDVEVELDNTAQDHRLRLHARAPFAASRFQVESAFECVERPIAPGPEDFGSAHPAERPIGAVPQRSFARVDDGSWALSVANRGSAEVEAVPEPDGGTSLAVTLLRAVGWLSRDDLALRPQAAGPTLPVPAAQVPGRHVAVLSLRLHPADEPTRDVECHRFAFPPVAFTGDSDPAAELRDGARLVEIEDPAVVLSALEPAQDGPLVRLYNAGARSRRARITWRGSEIRGLEPVDLAGRRRGEPAAGPDIELELRPFEIRGLRVRPA